MIIEAALLTDEEKVTACTLAKAAGADYVKTSTGFAQSGATVADVALMRRVVGAEMGVKAAGGVRDLERREGDGGGRRHPRRRQRRRQDRPRVARRGGRRLPASGYWILTQRLSRWTSPGSSPSAGTRRGSRRSSRFLTFSRAEWAPLRANTPLTLSDADLTALRGLNDVLSMEDVVEIYLPLSRLLSLYVLGTRALHGATSTFLATESAKTPFIIGLAGSVAVGKSTTARILQALLSRWPDHPRVDLITTDGFLLPNRVLEERGLMQRKGFPESYDRGRLVRFLADVKSGVAEVKAPVYSHVRYDIVPGAVQTVQQPDVVIVEGLNVLQAPPAVGAEMQLFASDFFDFTIFVDADETHHRGVVRRPVHEAARHGLPGSRRLLPPLRRAQRPRRARHRPHHLARDQWPQPAREHPHHPRPGPARARKGPGAPGPFGSPAAGLVSSPRSGIHAANHADGTLGW